MHRVSITLALVALVLALPAAAQPSGYAPVSEAEREWPSGR